MNGGVPNFVGARFHCDDGTNPLYFASVETFQNFKIKYNNNLTLN